MSQLDFVMDSADGKSAHRDTHRPAYFSARHPGCLYTMPISDTFILPGKSYLCEHKERLPAELSRHSQWISGLQSDTEYHHPMLLIGMPKRCVVRLDHNNQPGSQGSEWQMHMFYCCLLTLCDAYWPTALWDCNPLQDHQYTSHQPMTNKLMNHY